jgi:hypothetical protein
MWVSEERGATNILRWEHAWQMGGRTGSQCGGSVVREDGKQCRRDRSGILIFAANWEARGVALCRISTLEFLLMC